MSSLVDTIRKVRDRPAAGPPFLAEGPEPMLSVARDLYENPETVTLPDGRRLGYGETGDPDGDPVLAFHGVPSGRLGAAVYDQVALERGIRLIAPERPGVGASDPDPDRTLPDWPADVAAFLDALGIDAAPAIGISAGGPYALACGALAPERVPRVAVCCSIGPFDSADFQTQLLPLVATAVPWVFSAFLRAEVLSAQYAPAWTIDRRVEGATPQDESVWRGPVGKLLVASIPAACQRHGPATFVRDIRLFAGDWGFALGDVDVPVGIWHGRADRINPVEMGLALLDGIPTAEGHFYPDVGHAGVIVAHDGEMLDWLRH